MSIFQAQLVGIRQKHISYICIEKSSLSGNASDTLAHRYLRIVCFITNNMSSAPIECRLYVCKSTFGSIQDECIRFENIEQYLRWCEVGKTDQYTFHPLCNRMEVFDKMMLMLRSGKIGTINIKKFE